MLIAQITDTHIKAGGRHACGRVDTAAMLRACVADLLRQNPLPDLVLLTGDLADDGRAEDYALLRQLLAPLPMPLYPVAGNHDGRAALRCAAPLAARTLAALRRAANSCNTRWTWGRCGCWCLTPWCPGRATANCARGAWRG